MGAMSILSLRPNQSKSAVIIAGKKSRLIQEERETYRSDPVRMDGVPIEVKKVEAYLGFMLSEDGFESSVEMTIDARIRRGWMKAVEIKAIINHPYIKTFGWLKAACVLIQAILPPVLCYSTECWPGIPRYLMERLEAAFKDMVYSICQIPEKTKYSTVLLELGLTRIKHYAQKMQIGYMSQVIHDPPGSMVHNAVLEEFYCNGDNSLLGVVDRIATSYGLPRVSSTKIDHKLLKRVVKRQNDIEVWRDTFASPIAIERTHLRVRDKSHMSWDKNMAQALIAWRTGSLRFKSAWKIYNVKRGLGVHCVMPMCDAPVDNWSHMIRCKFYDTGWNEKWTSEKEIATYIVKASRERFVKVKMPLF